MKRIEYVLNVFFILIVTLCTPLSAEVNKEQADIQTNKFENGIGAYTPESKFSMEKNSAIKESVSKCSTINDKEIKLFCNKAFLKEFSNYEFELDHRENVLKWQHLSTQIILCVVLVLVSLGLYFAWVQFYSGEVNKETSEIEISTSGVKVSSPVLGVVILTLSLGFFYLYLVYVYPITVI